MVQKHISKIQARKENTHKGDFGHVFVVGGSKGMTGAAYLTSQAALFSGSGLVTCGIPETLNSIMEVKLTECMTLPLPETAHASIAPSAEKNILEFSVKSDVMAMGPGMSRHPETLRLVQSILPKITKPLVLDADGIIALEDHAEILKSRKNRTVITPHPGEMSRIMGKSVDWINANREKTASGIAKKYNVVVVLKGHHTVVADPAGDIFINKTGNSGMSTAGVGDVLTGIIASFIGQKIDPYSASVIGVYLHGLAGDMASKERGQFGMIAGDVLNFLPKAIIETL